MYALAIMFIGIAVGLLLKRTLVPGWIARLIMPAIVALLFFMGVSIGSNRQIMDNLPNLGVRGLILTLAALTGTLLAITLLSSFLPRPSSTHAGTAKNKPMKGRTQNKGEV